MPYSSLQFPAGGVARRLAYQYQSPFTCYDALNVWPDDAISGRERGGSRPGLELAYSTDMGSLSNLISMIRWSNSGTMTNTLVASGTNGNLYYTSTKPADTPGSLTACANMNSLSLPTNRLIMAIDYLQVLYVAAGETGTNKLCVYDPATDTYSIISESAGTCPTNCWGVTRYRDRIVLFNDRSNPHRIYASKQGDATNWDTTATTVDRSWAINAEDAGSIGEPVIACIPHAWDCMIIGCETSMYVLRGDVTYGGSVDLLSNVIGIVDRTAYCYDAENWLYWLSPDGLYAMPPGCGATPISISRETMPDELLYRDSATYRTTMAYDPLFRGIHLWSTSNVAGTSEHWFVDVKRYPTDAGPRGSFWPDTYASTNLDPMVCYNAGNFIPGNQNDGTVLIGARNGKIYKFARNVSQDDGTSYSSYVQYGPFPLGNPGHDGTLHELQVTTDTGSADVVVGVQVADSPQAAVSANEHKFTFPKSGANYTVRPRLRGASCCLKVQAETTGTKWAVDDITVNRVPAGRKKVMY